MKHFIAMNGSHGCLPDSCNVYLSERAAVDYLISLLGLSKRQKRELLSCGITECRQDQGAEYCEVTECECSSPHEHQDGETEEGFRENNPEFYDEAEES